MNDAYDKNLRSLLKETAKELKLDKYVKEGVYGNVAGPTYETIAELRMLQTVGVDAVGKKIAACMYAKSEHEIFVRFLYYFYDVF